MLEEKKERFILKYGYVAKYVVDAVDTRCQLARANGDGFVVVGFIDVLVVHLSQDVCDSPGNEPERYF